MEEYVNKEELKRRGFQRGKDHVWRQLSVLEQLAQYGWLEYGSRKFTALDRLSAGKRFYSDFHASGMQSLGVNDMERIKVDGGGNDSAPEYVLMARERFVRALRAINPDFFPVIHKVVLEDKMFSVTGSARGKTKEKAYKCTLLCLGLDELIYHYLKKHIDKATPLC